MIYFQGLMMIMSKVKTTITITVPLEVAERLKKGAQAQSAGRMGDYIIYLQEFYDMQHLDDLASRLSKVAKAGFNLQQIAYFSVLRTVVDVIAGRMGVR
jgi:hypothetical protein